MALPVPAFPVQEILLNYSKSQSTAVHRSEPLGNRTTENFMDDLFKGFYAPLTTFRHNPQIFGIYYPAQINDQQASF